MKRFLKWTWDILNKDIWWQQTPMILSTFECQDNPNQKKKKKNYSDCILCLRKKVMEQVHEEGQWNIK